MATPKQQLSGQIRTDVTRAAERLQVAIRQLLPLADDSEDLATIARAALAMANIQEAMRILESRGAQTTPPD